MPYNSSQRSALTSAYALDVKQEMNTEAKNALDLRLAKGEIDEIQYRKLLTAIYPPKQEKKSPLSYLAETKDNIFGTNKMRVPTSSDPLQVDRELSVYPDHLRHNDETIPITRISGLSYDQSSYSVNLVAVSLSTLFTISFIDRKPIGAGTNTMILRGKRAKLIQNAYLYLQKKTYKQRMNIYLEKLRTEGFFEAGDVRIFANGDVENEKLRLNLSRARKNRALAIGTQASFGLDKCSNPNEVVVGETGRSILSKRIIFGTNYNRDVVQSLIVWLSEKNA